LSLLPHNLIHLLPNLLILPRSLNPSFSDVGEGFIYSMVGGAGSTGSGSTSGVGFDVSITNKTGVKITVALDGSRFTVIDGEIKSISSRPFDKFQIIDVPAAATDPTGVDVQLMGLQMNDIESYTRQKPNFALWE
tara:strand:+ start:3645 stop:4049 length:405 start_codon:yes stop_codon:yes gene_type:complete